MTDEEFYSLIDDFENEDIEFRTEITKDGRDARNVASFFNTSGGKIIYGIRADDRQREVVGIENPQLLENNLVSQFRALCPDCNPNFEFKTLDGKICVIVHCYRGPNPPYKAGGVIYIRRGSNSIVATQEEVAVLYRDSGTETFDKRRMTTTTVGDLNKTSLQEYLKRTSAREIDEEDFSPSLARLGFTKEEGGVIGPSVAAILLFGNNPQLSMPHARIKADAKRDPESTEWDDIADIEGNLFDQIRNTELFFKRNLRVSAKIIGFERVEMPQLPPEALREAVINAVAHRDYAKTESEILIHLVGNKVIVENPGRLLAPLTVEAILSGRFSPRARNPLIAHVLDKSGFMDKRGSGIMRMRKLMSEFNLAPPLFEELEDSFRVTFDSSPIKEDNKKIFIPPDILTKANLDSEQKRILRLIEQNKEVTTIECEKCIHLSKPPTLKRLRSLMEAGLIETTGQNQNDPNTKYRLHERFSKKQESPRSQGNQSTTPPLFS